MSTSPAVPLPPLRILLDNGFQSGPLDGAWWPRSHDLASEAADLVDQFPHLLGRVTRLLFSRPDWDSADAAPGVERSIHQVRTSHGMVKAGSFPRDDTHTMILKLASGQRLRLLVVPSETEPDVAAQVMEKAADERNTASARTLLGLAPADAGL